jgi:hypothetical protein
MINMAYAEVQFEGSYLQTYKPIQEEYFLMNIRYELEEWLWLVDGL